MVDAHTSFGARPRAIICSSTTRCALSMKPFLTQPFTSVLKETSFGGRPLASISSITAYENLRDSRAQSGQTEKQKSPEAEKSESIDVSSWMYVVPAHDPCSLS